MPIRLLLLLILSSQAFSSPTVVRYSQIEPRYEYVIRLLELALKETENSHGPYQLSPISRSTTKKRQELIFLDGGFDIMWMPTTKERENQFLAIKTPLLKGILGYRVFLIHKDSQNDFANISSLADLKNKFTAGFGSHWADLEILNDNGISVTHTPISKNLVPMLHRNRFDYFPRGIDEAWLELKEISDQYPNITVENI